MRKVSFADMPCAIAQSLEIVGEWWTLLILRDSFLGVHRFDDFVDRLGISRNVLTDRLDKLVAAGVLERRPYDEGRRRYDYVLTEKGLALWPVLTALREWGDDWILGPGNEPVMIEHRACGQITRATPVCSCCGEPLDARSVRAVAGPGAEPDTTLPPPSATSG
ncbi:MAG: winged helix-turn-helix transcriptional regulator [Acidimicrobiales bacterium]